MMTTLASIALATLVTADAERVWDALTATKTSLPYFHGMTVTSDWRPGSTITMRQEDELRQGDTRKFWDVAICGEVLAADPPHRLSYTLGECQSDPTVYVTWELRCWRRTDDRPALHRRTRCISGLRRRPRHHLAPDPLRLDREPQQPTSNRASCITPRLNHRSPHRVQKHRGRRETPIAHSAGQSLRKGASS